jgi:hypothetical protein
MALGQPAFSGTVDQDADLQLSDGCDWSTLFMSGVRLTYPLANAVRTLPSLQLAGDLQVQDQDRHDDGIKQVRSGVRMALDRRYVRGTSDMIRVDES